MIFNPGFNIEPTTNPMGFVYGADVFGPQVENRLLKDIRKSLSDPDCEGPEVVYAIAMDVGKKIHAELLKERHLLYGVVTYAAGKLGKEPIRSQGTFIGFQSSVIGLLRKFMRYGRVKLLFICRSLQKTIPDVALPFMPIPVML
jgi:hypothetical protein